jgi:23S rRNA (adenine2030-N6)-methyltransferase
MNYRHAYHAGNFADVVKHAILAMVVTSLKRKDTPFFALDTHAGLGAYNLEADEAQRTGEFRSGIARLLEASAPPAALDPYLAAVRALNPAGGCTCYPGSPELVRGMMRETDRLALVELHPEDVAVLRRRFAADRRVGIHHMDGYVAVKGLLPPPERRGVVLIDPPFEVKDEHQRLLSALRRIRRRWANAITLVWYPIKGMEPVEQVYEALRAEGGVETLAVELMLRPPLDPFRLNGSGLIVVNPPWGLDRELAVLLPWLVSVLAPDGGFHRLETLVSEADLCG